MLRDQYSPSTAPGKYIRELPAKLRQDLREPLLSLWSRDDDEAYMARLAVLSLLETYGLDWPDFVNWALSDRELPEPPPSHEPGFSSPMDPGELQDAVDFIREHNPHLSENSESFLESLEDRAGQYDEVLLSDRQLKWLRDLHVEAKSWVHLAEVKEKRRGEG